VQALSTHSPLGQALPQAPQFCASALRSRQVPSHIVLPLGHVQVPFEQLDPPRHALPHAPQLALLVVKSKQTPAQRAFPAGH
jgi:hypothetical protein